MKARHGFGSLSSALRQCFSRCERLRAALGAHGLLGRRSRSLVSVAAVGLVLLTLAAPSAQQPPPQPSPAQPANQPPQAPAQPANQPGAPPPAPGTPPKPLVPLAASTLAANPESYIGEWVTVTAAVEQTLAPLAFSLDQDKTKSTGKEVLVLAPRMNSPVDLNTYVTVIGEVVRFDPDEITKKSKDYKVDFPADVVAKFKGRPAVLATAVVNSAGLDVAKKPLPPMTADDELLTKIMKQVGPANQALRTDIEKMDVNLTKEHATVLKQAFAQTEAFWKTKGKPNAIQWSQEARKAAEGIDLAVASGNWEGVKSSAATLGQQCGACHNLYRERLEDGTYRVKLGGM
jgi:cytochrome c556